jgi:hypothetical protein
MGKYFNAFIMAIITFFSPIAGLLLAVGAMIFTDTILGVTIPFDLGATYEIS